MKCNTLQKGTRVYIKETDLPTTGMIGTIIYVFSVSKLDSKMDMYGVELDKEGEDLFFRFEMSVLDFTPSDFSYRMMIDMLKTGVLPPLEFDWK